MPKTIFLLGLLAALCVGKAPDCRAARSEFDYLVPVKKALGLRAAYEELWQQKLLVTPGEIARFVGLPGTTGVETTISVYRAPGKESSLPGNYWVTATQASERLWNCVAPDATVQVDPDTITVQRCDAPIAESTAIAMRETWLTMLSLARPQRDSREITVDSSREIFSVVDSDGRVLQAESSTAPNENTKALINIALSLLEYCGADVPKRATIATEIEKAASNLLGRVASPSGSKKRDQQLPASSKTAVTPRRQYMLSSTSCREPARQESVTRLGSSINDFRSRSDPPIRQEVVARSASLVWKPAGRENTALRAGIDEAELSSGITPRDIRDLELLIARRPDILKPLARVDLMHPGNARVVTGYDSKVGDTFDTFTAIKRNGRWTIGSAVTRDQVVVTSAH